MNQRENVLRAIRFERPDHIPVYFHVNSACWHHYDQNALQDLMEAHRMLFPDFVRQKVVTPPYGVYQRKDQPYTDAWGCVWETTDDGITGAVHHHPLADWSAFAQYKAPDPRTANKTFSPDMRAAIQRRREQQQLIKGGLPHGHTFLRLQDIRGYENLLLDMADGDPRLDQLIGMVEAYNYACVEQWLTLKPDIMSYPEDLGMQVGPMLSPDSFRTYIKPVYQRLMKPARDAGCIVHMHSDGDIRTLVDDLIDGGVEVINLQDLVNGIDWIADRFAGRVCIDLDIDRQQITARGTPAQVDALIREEVEKLGSKQGGLMMIYGMYPGVPLENAKALMDAMEKYSIHYS
jgi:uroporphyrinogen-III decarboxylase